MKPSNDEYNLKVYGYIEDNEGHTLVRYYHIRVKAIEGKQLEVLEIWETDEL